MHQSTLNPTPVTDASAMQDQAKQPATIMMLGCVAHGFACMSSLTANTRYRGADYAAILNWYQRLHSLTDQAYQTLTDSNEAETARAFFEHLFSTYLASLSSTQLAACVDALLGDKTTYLYCALEEKAEMDETGAAEVKQQLAHLRAITASVAEACMPDYQAKRWQLLYEVIHHEATNASSASTRSARRAAKYLLNVHNISASNSLGEIPSFAQELLKSPTVLRICAAADVPVSSLKTFGISAIARGAQGKGLTTADELMQLWHLGYCALTTCAEFSQNTTVANAANELLASYQGRETDQPVDEEILDAHIHHVQVTESQVGRDEVDAYRHAYERAVRDHSIPELVAALNKGASRHYASCAEFSPSRQTQSSTPSDELMEFSRGDDGDRWDVV